MMRLIALVTALAISGSANPAGNLKLYTEVAPPQQILGTDGQLSGIAIDVVREIQRRIGNTDPIEILPWARGYEEVQSRPNVALFSMARTPERNGLFQWVGPLDDNVYSLYVKADSGLVIRNLDDAKKLRAIGVYRNDVRDLFLTKSGFTNLDRVKDNATNLRKLLAGRLDAFAAAHGEIEELTKAAGCEVSDLKEALPFLKIQLFIAFSKGTPEATVETWSRTLEAMKKDKTFERIYRRYEPTKPLPEPSKTAF